MQRIPKPVLWWSSEGDGSGALSGVLTDKKVWLNGLYVRQHTPFQIRRRNLLTRIPWLGRGLFGGWVGDMPTVYLGGGSMRSTTHWQATNVSLVPSSTDYFFVDGNGGVSGTLAVSNTPSVRWRSVKHGGVGLKPKLVGGLSSNGLANGYARAELFHLGREYEVTWNGVVVAPEDPRVEIEVLEPGTSEDLLLEIAYGVLSQELQGSEVTQNDRLIASALSHIRSFLGRRYIDFAVNGETRFIATASEPSPISLTVRGDGPVRLLFAIKVLDLDTGASSISEFMPLMITQPRLS